MTHFVTVFQSCFFFVANKCMLSAVDYMNKNELNPFLVVYASFQFSNNKVISDSGCPFVLYHVPW